MMGEVPGLNEGSKGEWVEDKSEGSQELEKKSMKEKKSTYDRREWLQQWRGT
jgi:hypothetical protein